MIRKFCDRCGMEAVVSYDINVDIDDKGNKHLDFCLDCKSELVRFLRGSAVV